MRSFRPSTPEHHLARRNEAAGSPSVLDQFNAWVSSFFAPSEPPPPPPAPGQPHGPGSPDGTPVAKGSKAYNAILAELNKKYGPLTRVGYRDVDGDGNYVYREYSDGRIFIQFSGRPQKDPIPPKVIKSDTTGGGAPPWVLPVAIVGGAALIGAGIYFWPKLRKKMGR